MRPDRRRRPAGSARCRRSGFASRPSRRRTPAATCSRDDWAPRRAWLLKVSARSSEFLPLLDPIGTFGIGDRHQADDAAVALLPVPGEQREGDAPAGDLVEIAAHILDAQDAVLEQDAMHRLPFRKIVLPVAAARPFLVFLRQM